MTVESGTPPIGARIGEKGVEKQAAHERKKSERSWSFARGAILDKKRPSAKGARGSPRRAFGAWGSPLENSGAGFEKSRPRKEKLGAWKWAMRAFTGRRATGARIGEKGVENSGAGFVESRPRKKSKGEKG